MTILDKIERLAVDDEGFRKGAFALWLAVFMAALRDLERGDRGAMLYFSNADDDAPFGILCRALEADPAEIRQEIFREMRKLK